MEIIDKKYDTAQQTLVTLKKSLDLLYNPQYQEIKETLRDSVIKRFEYSIDTFWKFIKLYLQEAMKVDIEGITTRIILRKAVESNLISEVEFNKLIDCLSDRNLTSHTYNEYLAQDILGKIESYYQLMEQVLIRIKL